MITTKKNRPVNLNLRNIKFPLTAIASISHRISGIIIFVIIGLLLSVLKFSLTSIENFYQVKLLIDNLIIKFIIWNIVIFFIYHVINGIRHIFMDFGFLNKTLEISKKSANIVFILTSILSVLFGLLLCEIF